ncbi:hypothetical protein [Streptomyces sp. NPDC048659]|uniref:hypothetical protein n=1 Tax=Streptomyces sp. NPDC048659 TaxID=3155489 RepID=UPI003424A2DC
MVDHPLETPAQGTVRIRDRFGSVVVACTSVLSVEAVIAVIAVYVWELTKETPPLPYNGLAVFVMVVALPFVAAAGAALAALLSICVLMPMLAVAARLGRAVSGREAWWWVPAAAGGVAALPAGAEALTGETGLLGCVAGWLVATVALAVPALTARRLLLPERPRLSGGAMFGYIALWGTLAAVTAFTLAGIAVFAGVGYEAPRLDEAQVAGTYADGEGGTLTLAPDGTATANRVKTFTYDEHSTQPLAKECTGAGTWTYTPADSPTSQRVDVTIDACPGLMDSWNTYGSAAHPKLYVFMGDPDTWDIYTLRRG